MPKTTLTQVRKEHPLFFENCKNSRITDISFIGYFLTDKNCFITKEVLHNSDESIRTMAKLGETLEITETSFKVWFVPSKGSIKPVGTFTNVFRAKDCAEEYTPIK